MSQAEALPDPASAPTGFRASADINPLNEIAVETEGKVLAVSRATRRRLTRHGQSELARLRDSRRSDICVIAGNGPGLNRVNWSELRDADLIAANYARLHPELAERATILSVTNPWVISQQPEAFHRQAGQRVAMPYYLAYWLPEAQWDITLDCHNGFEPAAALNDPISTRSTVSYFNLQLAFLLGYRRVVLIGFDHSYQQPTNAAEGEVLTEGEEDPNHFSPGYFAGKRWQAADTTRMELAYAYAQRCYRLDGREIVNSSDPTQLTLFPRVPLADTMADVPNPTEPTEAPTLGRRCADLIDRVRTESNATVLLAALLIGLPLAAALSTINGLWALAGGLSASIGVLLINASVNVRRRQTADELIELFASIHRAEGPAQNIGQDDP